MDKLATIILAAGKGTRMKSKLPKVLHKLCGKTMVQYVLDCARKIGADRNIVVVGHAAECVKEACGAGVEYAYQLEQLGTGHAVMQAEKVLGEDFDGNVLVLCGDTPLLEPEMLNDLVGHHMSHRAVATILTAVLPDPTGYGRVVRGAGGEVVKIVEQKDAVSAELAIREINTGIYCFDAKALFDALREIKPANRQSEYYLTDVIEIFVRRGLAVEAVQTANIQATMGVNTRKQLAEAATIIRREICDRLMLEGVTIIDPVNTYIDAGVEIAPDTIIYPFCVLEGETSIGENCTIGPSVRLKNVKVGNNVVIHYSVATDSIIGDDAQIGPFAHLRPEAEIGEKAKIGNFVEIKKSQVGCGSKVSHLSYIGDTTIGTGVNIGAGVITVNYDGKHKHRTIIEDEAFVGCNANLVAPVTIERRSYVAAGSTVTKDVPSEALAVARARQTNIEGWVKRKNQ